MVKKTLAVAAALLSLVCCEKGNGLHDGPDREETKDLSYTVNAVKLGDGVEINGIVWAPVNVGAKTQFENGTLVTWEQAQTACPSGWRLPSKSEIFKLISNHSDFIRDDEKKGYWFSGNKQYADGVPAIFLPAAGMDAGLGSPSGVGTDGYYWTSDAFKDGDMEVAYQLNFYSSAVNVEAIFRTYGFSVRCVKK